MSTSTDSNLSEVEIEKLLNSCAIDAIIAGFEKKAIFIGGTKTAVEQEFANIDYLARSDLAARLERDPAVHNDPELILRGRDTAFRALILHRVAHALWSPQHIAYSETESHKARCIAFQIYNFALCRFAVDIHPGACIGKALYLDHVFGTRINNGVVVGENCAILDAVCIGPWSTIIGEQAKIGDYCSLEGENVLGAFIKHNASVASLEKERGRRHPVIGDRCFLCRGASVLGPFTVAADSFITIGKIITQDYPSAVL